MSVPSPSGCICDRAGEFLTHRFPTAINPECAVHGIQKWPASTPIVSRSQFVQGVLLMRGEQFEDGKDRLVVPQSTTDDEVADAERTMAEHNERMAEFDRLTEIVTRSMSRGGAR